MLKLMSGFVQNDIILYTGTFALTILLSVVSYELFESRFIKTKKKYSPVISGDNASEGEAVTTKVLDIPVMEPAVSKTV
jgi:hypothetical protein